MEFWTMIAIGTIIYKLINKAHEADEEEERRRNTPCNFEDGISEEQFRMIVRQASKHIKRLTNLSIDGSVVYGTVRTNSGLSEWTFKVDFNDYGHITGKYWLSLDNNDSSIPKNIAEKIKVMIHSFPEGFEQTKITAEFNRHVNSNIYDNIELDRNAQNGTNIRKIRQQAELLSKNRKGKIKKGIIIFSCLMLLIMILFGFYQYTEEQKCIKVGISSFKAIGQDYEQIIKELEDAGFTNIHANPEYDLEIEDIENENMISMIEIHGDNIFYDSSKYPFDAPIKITFHAMKNIYVPISAKEAKKMDFIELETMLRDAGFVNISTQAKYDLIMGWLTKDKTVEEILINGETRFSENSLYRPDAEIIITYHTFKKNKD